MTITTYQEVHKTAIANLIINIQRGKGNFWVALNDEQQVIGTLAVIDMGEESGAIRKMFVHKDYRGKEFGVAQRLFDTLIEWANEQNIQYFYLGTLERLGAARRFYERNGFALIEKGDLPPSFPLMAVDTHFYAKKLG